MGCLMEFLVQILIEGILSLVMSVYLKLAHILVPNKEISEKTRNKMKNIITTISVLLILGLFLGIIFLLPPDARFNTIGKYMILLPLFVIALQVVLGIIVTIVRVIRLQKK